MKDEHRMIELKQTHVIRLGVGKDQQKNIADFKKTLESKGWKVQVIPCPDKRLTGLLRSGALDLIYFPGATEAEAERRGFRFIAPSFFIDNLLLLQEIR